MSSSQVLKWLEDAHEDVARLLAPTSDGSETRAAITHASHRLYNARPALPGAQAFDSDRISGGGSGSKPPPGFEMEDKAKADRDELHMRARRMREDADWLLRCVVRWNPRVPTGRDRELTAMNERGEKGCQHCATVGHWRELKVENSTVKGTLSEPMALCSACYRMVLTHGVLPTRKQLEDARDKGAWKEPA